MRKRIFLSFIALIIIFGVLSSALVASIISTIVPQQVMIRLESETRLLIPRMADNGDQAAFDQLLSTSRITHIAQDGTVLFDSQSPQQQLDNHADREEVRQAFQSGAGSAVAIQTRSRPT